MYYNRLTGRLTHTNHARGMSGTLYNNLIGESKELLKLDGILECTTVNVFSDGSPVTPSQYMEVASTYILEEGDGAVQTIVYKFRDNLIELALAAAKKKRDKKIHSGVGGFQTDEISISRLTGALLMLGDNASIKLRNTNNEFVELSNEQFRELCTSVFAHIQNCYSEHAAEEQGIINGEIKPWMN